MLMMNIWKTYFRHWHVFFVEKGTRESISYITKRYSKVNNKYIKLYDDSNSSKYIAYLNENNLYDWPKGWYFPYGWFRWLTMKEINGFHQNSVFQDSSDGYVKEWHDLRNNYHLAHEKHEIKLDMLSNYCVDVVDKYNIKVSGVKKNCSKFGQ